MAAFAWLLSCWTAAFCVEIWAQNRRNYSPQFGKRLLTRHYIRTISSTVVASNTDKPTHTWWLASKFRTMPLVMKCQIAKSPIRKAELPQHKLESPWAHWPAKASQVACFALKHGCFCMVAFVLDSCLLCRDLGPK